jgi:GT2 family glycosyltransferase
LPQLSVVIPVYNNWWLTRRCLRELDGLRGATGIRFETLVVDNASSDETPSAIAEFPGVRYIRHETNENFAGACNSGARAAQTPLTLFLNNDAYPLGNALAPLVTAFERDEVAIAGGALFFEDGATQAAGLALLPNDHWHYLSRNLTSDDVSRSRDALAVSGAAMAVRTRWFLDQGGFDESFVNGFEDVDLCMRAREQGHVIAYVAEARFAHYEAASAGRFDREAENEKRFYERWRAGMAQLPRTLRGDVGAIAILTGEADTLLTAARIDLESALRGFGHPIVHGAIAPWSRADRRFRRAGYLAWFTAQARAPGVAIARCGDRTLIRTAGAVELEEPWLAGAAPERAGRCGVRRCDDAACTAVGIAGSDEAIASELSHSWPVVRIAPQMLLGEERVDVACVVHAGTTDDSGFGNVLLAQAALPAIVLGSDELRGLFSADVAYVRERGTIGAAVAEMIADPKLRKSYGTLGAADARRRFSPRRSAIRVVDLLCAARFGWERPQGAP